MDPQVLLNHGFTPAPLWSMEVGQLGAGLIIFGSILFLYSLAAMAVGGRFQSAARWTFAVGCVAILGAMGCLLMLFTRDQFQYEYVNEHSWRNLALQYKVAAVWSGQQGSFLLWATTSAAFGLLVFWRTGPYQRWFVFAYSIFLGSLCGILAYETPFGVMRELVIGTQHLPLVINGVLFALPDGQGLTPSLQNYWVVVHPPTIFTGFGSLTVLFAYAVSAMMTGNVKDWLPRVRPWALISLSILGLGLVMGGLWAYETLGWGGFWAWDPVENVSFVPWLFTVAFVHGIIVQTTRGRWHWTNLLLGGLPFLLFTYGTFLTRSGFLNKFSNHSFAEMNGSALLILMAFMIAVTVAFVGLWAVRGRKLGTKSDAPRKLDSINREQAYELGVILLSGLSTVIAIGMSIPFFIGLFGGSGKVVEEPLYHAVVVWFFAPIMVLIGAAPFLSWRGMALGQILGRLLNIVALTLGVVGLMMIVLRWSDWGTISGGLAKISFPFHIFVPRFGWVMCLFSLTAFAVIGNVWRLAELFRRSKLGVGSFVAHIGVSTALAGLVLSRGLEVKSQILVAQGSPGTGLGYTLAYKDLTSNPDTDRNDKVEFAVRSDPTSHLSGGWLAKLAAIVNGPSDFVARPGLFYITGDDGQPQAFTWPHIQREATHDVYLSLDAPVVNFWTKPQVFNPGQTISTKLDDGGEVDVKYLGFIRKGEPGKAGTSFAARIQVTEEGETFPVVEPAIIVGGDQTPVRASPSFYAVFDKMDAASKAAEIDLLYVNPVYPIELFYKPMTMLVWIGTGIMFLGGLLSAYYRRNRRLGPSPERMDAEIVGTANVEEIEDAPVPVA